MLDSIKSFFNRNIDSVEEQTDDLASGSPRQQQDSIQIAACALLLELAHADDEFTADERAHIEEALVRHFDVPSDTANELIALAEEERTRAVDLYQFTRLITERYDIGQKMVLAEVMWRVLYADGELAKHESYLMRQVSNLLGLKPGYLAQARKKASGEG